MRTILISSIGATLLAACSTAEPAVDETSSVTLTDATVASNSDAGGSTGDPPTTDPTSPTTDPTSPTSSESATGTATDPPETTEPGTVTGADTEGESTDPGPGTTTTGETTGDTGDSSSGGLLPDVDDDTVPDEIDNCVMVANPDQADADMNGIGDACEDDDDDDDDGVPDDSDNCPLVPNPDQKDFDSDGIGDACDEDADGDTVVEPGDNCPLLANPDQKDSDNDGVGDLCDPDKDNDGIPNDDDVFPEDKDQPGVVVPKKIYAHSSGALSTVDVFDYTVASVGNFTWPNDGGSHQMTDVAIDRWGVLYGVTFDSVYVCNPTSAQCFFLAKLNGSYNGLTWIPAGTLDPDKDSLIAITNTGTWNHLKIMNGQVTAVQLGTYGAGYTSAGDAFSIEGVGTYAAVNKNGQNSTIIVAVDPLNGKVLSELAVTQGYNSVFGLAGWQGLIIAFDSSKAMIKIDPQTKVVTNLGVKNVAWWGAGVGTLLPQ